MKQFLVALSVLILLLSVPVGVGSSILQQPVKIRVAVNKGSESIRLNGNGVLATDESGTPQRLTFPQEIRRGKDGILLNGRTLRALYVSGPLFVLVNGRGYRGVVEITAADKGLLVVNELPLEDYLVGLINCEISSQWPMEAIKAQAVIARSYAIFQREARKNAPYHLEASVLDQVYEGCDIEDSRAARGVKETANEVLTYNGSVIQAFYHSNCGGHTEASVNVWGYPQPYLQGVECRYCLSAGAAKWEQRISLKTIETALKAAGYKAGGLRDIKAGERNNSGRLSELILILAKGRVTIPAVGFRKALGYTTIKSTNFTISVVDDNVTFSGTGYGHGVGLCQWGAKQRAGDGFDYREILTYYYPGTRLDNLLN